MEKSAQRAFVALLKRSLNKVKSQSNDVEAASGHSQGRASPLRRHREHGAAARRLRRLPAALPDRALFAFNYLEDAVKAKNAKNIDAGIAEILRRGG